MNFVVVCFCVSFCILQICVCLICSGEDATVRAARGRGLQRDPPDVRPDYAWTPHCTQQLRMVCYRGPSLHDSRCRCDDTIMWLRRYGMYRIQLTRLLTYLLQVVIRIAVFCDKDMYCCRFYANFMLYGVTTMSQCERCGLEQMFITLAYLYPSATIRVCIEMNFVPVTSMSKTLPYVDNLHENIYMLRTETDSRGRICIVPHINVKLNRLPYSSLIEYRKCTGCHSLSIWMGDNYSWPISMLYKYVTWSSVINCPDACHDSFHARGMHDTTEMIFCTRPNNALARPTSPAWVTRFYMKMPGASLHSGIRKILYESTSMSYGTRFRMLQYVVNRFLKLCMFQARRTNKDDMGTASMRTSRDSQEIVDVTFSIMNLERKKVGRHYPLESNECTGGPSVSLRHSMNSLWSTSVAYVYVDLYDIFCRTTLNVINQILMWGTLFNVLLDSYELRFAMINLANICIVDGRDDENLNYNDFTHSPYVYSYSETDVRQSDRWNMHIVELFKSCTMYTYCFVSDMDPVYIITSTKRMLIPGRFINETLSFRMSLAPSGASMTNSYLLVIGCIFCVGCSTNVFFDLLQFSICVNKPHMITMGLECRCRILREINPQSYQHPPDVVCRYEYPVRQLNLSSTHRNIPIRDIINTWYRVGVGAYGIDNYVKVGCAYTLPTNRNVHSDIRSCIDDSISINIRKCVLTLHVTVGVDAHTWYMLDIVLEYYLSPILTRMVTDSCLRQCNDPLDMLYINVSQRTIVSGACAAGPCTYSQISPRSVCAVSFSIYLLRLVIMISYFMYTYLNTFVLEVTQYSVSGACAAILYTYMLPNRWRLPNQIISI